MGDPTDIGALTLAVGEMRGQLRELVHGQNNMAQKMESLTEKVLLAQALPVEVARLADILTVLSARIDALESTNDRNDGAKGVFAAILQSRFAAWAAAAVAVAYAAIKGDVLK
jgi:hypothetical protein